MVVEKGMTVEAPGREVIELLHLINKLFPITFFLVLVQVIFVRKEKPPRKKR